MNIILTSLLVVASVATQPANIAREPKSIYDLDGQYLVLLLAESSFRMGIWNLESALTKNIPKFWFKSNVLGEKIKPIVANLETLDSKYVKPEENGETGETIRRHVILLESIRNQLAKIFKRVDEIRGQISIESQNAYTKLRFMSEVIDGHILCVKTSLSIPDKSSVPLQLSLDMAYGYLKIGIGYAGAAGFENHTIVARVDELSSKLATLDKSPLIGTNIAFALEAVQSINVSSSQSDLAGLNTQIARSLLSR